MTARDSEEIIGDNNSWTKFLLNKRQPSKLWDPHKYSVLINVRLSCLWLQWIFKRPSNEVKIKLTIKHLAFANSPCSWLKTDFTHVLAHKLKRTPSYIRLYTSNLDDCKTVLKTPPAKTACSPADPPELLRAICVLHYCLNYLILFHWKIKILAKQRKRKKTSENK